MKVRYRSRGSNPHTSTSRIFPTHSSSSPNPVSRKLRSASHRASTKTATPSTPQESVTMPCRISIASNTVSSPTAIQDDVLAGNPQHEPVPQYDHNLFI